MDALDRIPYLRIVFLIREEYLAQFDPFAEIFPEGFRHRFRLEPLRRNPAIEAIKGPLLMTNFPRSYDLPIDRLVDELLKIHVETPMGELRQLKGEFVEPIHLQVVCETLWRKLTSSSSPQIISEEYLGEINHALEKFYTQVVLDTAKKTGQSEDDIREWFEKTLITSTGTRSIVHRGPKSTGGMPNSVVDFLESKYLIRGEWRSGARWYELTHDKFIFAVRQSNEVWRKNSRSLWKTLKKRLHV